MYKKSSTSPSPSPSSSSTNDWTLDSSGGEWITISSMDTGTITGLAAGPYGVTSGTITMPIPGGTTTTTTGGSIQNPYFGYPSNAGASSLEKYFQRMQYSDPEQIKRVAKLRVFFQSLKKKYFNPSDVTEHLFSDNLKKRQAAKELVEEMNFNTK